MVPLRTSALDNCRDKCGRIRGLEAVRQHKASSVGFQQLCHVAAAWTHRSLRCVSAPSPLTGFSREKPPPGFSRLIPHNSKQNAKYSAPPPKRLQMEISLRGMQPQIGACLCCVHINATFQLLWPFRGAYGTDAARQSYRSELKKKKVDPEFVRHARNARTLLFPHAAYSSILQTKTRLKAFSNMPPKLCLLTDNRV